MNRIHPPGNYQNRKHPAAYQSVDNQRHGSISDLRAVKTSIPPEDYPLETEHESFYNKGYRQIKSSHVARTTDRKAYSTKTRRAPEPPLKPPGRTKPNNHYTNVSSRYEGEKFEPNEDYPIEEIRDYDVVSRTIDYSLNLENVGKEISPNVKVPSSKTTRAPMPLLSNLKRSDSTHSFGAKSVSINPMRSNRKQFESIKEDNSTTRSDFPLHDGDINDAMLPFTRDNDSLSQLGAEDLYGVCATNKRTSISIGSSGRTSIGGTHISVSQTESQLIENLVETSKAYLNQYESRKTFVQTSGWLEAIQKIDYHRKVVLSSGHGGGKTFFGTELLLRYSKLKDQFNKPKTPVILRFPRHWEMVVNPKEDVIILLDDIFGKVNVDFKKLNEWQILFSDIHTCINDESCSVYVVITIRDNILRQVKKLLTRHELFRNIDNFLVNISMDNEDDRKMILKGYIPHALSNDRNITPMYAYVPQTFDATKQIREILNIQTPFAFPLCCAEYINNREYFNQGTEFFRNPLEILLPEFHSIYTHDKFTFFFLAIILFSPYQFVQIDSIDRHNTKLKTLLQDVATICNINCTYPYLLGKLEDKIQELENIFISEDNGRVYFISEAILGVMIHIVGENQIHYLIENLDFPLLLRFTTLNQTRNKRFVISPRYYHDLVDRFLVEIEKGSLKDVVGSEAMETDSFVNKFVEQLKVTLHYKTWLGKGKRVDSILLLAIMHYPPRYKLMRDIMKHAPQKEKGLLSKHKVYPNWFRTEVYNVLKLALERNDMDSCLMLSCFFKHLPDEILLSSAKCNNRRLYDHFCESYQWSRESKIKATKIRKELQKTENTIDYFHLYPRLLENDNINNQQQQTYQFSTSLF